MGSSPNSALLQWYSLNLVLSGKGTVNILDGQSIKGVRVRLFFANEDSEVGISPHRVDIALGRLACCSWKLQVTHRRRNLLRDLQLHNFSPRYPTYRAKVFTSRFVKNVAYVLWASTTVIFLKPLSQILSIRYFTTVAGVSIAGDVR